jgi:hypothetical protein
MEIPTFKEYCEAQETSYEDKIMLWLRSMGGEVVVVASIARKFKVGDASILALLNELAATGKVRRSNAKRGVGFYIPTEAMLNAERRNAEEVKPRPELKVDKHRRDLYAQLDAARSQIKSIG